ncbi:MAG: helix-turn-helix domain-containing protein [Actinomycetota bacterium]|nr:helix-turn-helix domain-containing protein [Actinomycetota bacterium]
MLTVPEAARRVGKDPETVRRWIRAGRLRSQKVGTQHLIEEADLDALVSKSDRLARPAEWETTRDGRPMPDAVALIREIRDSR